MANSRGLGRGLNDLGLNALFNGNIKDGAERVEEIEIENSFLGVLYKTQFPHMRSIYDKE